jgi:invasion protein IalB
MSRVLLFTFVMCALQVGAPLAGLAGEEPQATTATYGAWTLRCAAPPPAPPATDAKAAPATSSPSPGVQQCEIAQSVQVQGQQAPIVQIAVGRSEQNGPLRFVVQVPVGSWLPAGVNVQIADKGDPIALTYKRCLPGACLADTEFSAALRDTMKAQKTDGKITFQLVADKALTVPISFNGFASALEAMEQALK